LADDAALDALYQEIILDHYRRPRNFRELPNATCTADGKNPNCGDALTVWLKFDGDIVADVTFQGVGCAISKASASLMTQAVKGRTRAEAAEVFEKVHRLVTGTETDAATSKELGQLRALAGVSKFPMRVKCASLAWHTLKSAMEGHEPEVVVHTGPPSA
jgi:nitrogen fixation protein NifU and related proteins